MRVSVVTISLNQAAFLPRALNSIIAQSWKDKELIVVDPGSTDGSRKVIADYGSRIDRTILDADRGPADGLNKGFARATGDIFCFLNSDDEFLPGAFERMVDEFSRRARADFLSGCGYVIDADGLRLRRLVPTRITVPGYLYGACTLFQQGTFFRRHCYEKVGGFNVENRSCWDGELFLDFARSGLHQEIVYHDVANFRIHGASITGSGTNGSQYQRDERAIFAKAWGRLPNRADALIGAGFRATKLIRNPRYAIERLVGR